MKDKKAIYKLPRCNICNDTRVMTKTDSHFGEITVACKCVDYGSKLDRLRKARIPDNNIGWELSDYTPELYSVVNKAPLTSEEVGKNKVAVTNIQEILKSHRIVSDNGIDIFLGGGVACGKSLLATVMLKTLILKYGYSGLFVTADQIVLMAQDKISFNKTDYKGPTYDEMMEVDFLLIDGFHNLIGLNVSTLTKITIRSLLKERKSMKKSFIMTSRSSFKEMINLDQICGEFAHTRQEIRLRGQFVNQSSASKLKLTKYEG